MSFESVFSAPPHAVQGCPLCEEPGGVRIWSDADWRVVRIEDGDFPAFYRVVSHQHVAEFSSLDPERRRRCMDLVAAVDRVLVERLKPTKVNLAALGNMVPHLHWHVVARFDWDSRFPHPIWSAPQREVVPPASARLGMTLEALDAAVVAACRGCCRE
jgi:diadenosine tetraphosphate (Ap4A) HIT family hydrolase